MNGGVWMVVCGWWCVNGGVYISCRGSPYLKRSLVLTVM